VGDGDEIQAGRHGIPGFASVESVVHCELRDLNVGPSLRSGLKHRPTESSSERSDGPTVPTATAPVNLHPSLPTIAKDDLVLRV